MNILVRVSLFPYGRVFLGHRPANTIGCFQVYLKEDSESPPVMLESPHYSLSLLNSDVRLQSNGFEMHAGCGSDSISRITRELEPFSHLSQNISMLSLCSDLGHWTMVRMLDWHKGCHDLTSSATSGCGLSLSRWACGPCSGVTFTFPMLILWLELLFQ